MESESSEALQHGLLFCWCLRALVWQEGTTLFTSVSTGNPSGPRGMDVSVRAVARLGRWGAPLLTGSVGKLIDFISVSHTTPNPYWPDIHMFTVQRIMGLPSPVYLFFLFHFLFFSRSLVFLMFPICLSSTMFCLLSTIITISLPLVPA